MEEIVDLIQFFIDRDQPSTWEALHKKAELSFASMTTKFERSCYYELARGASGNIVELGPWIGGSTTMILKGMIRSAHLHCFDHFIWQKWMDGRGCKVEYNEGDSFLPHFVENITPFIKHNRISIHNTNLIHDLPIIKNIGLIIIDAFKNTKSTNSAAKHFFPHVKTGCYIVDQDLFFKPEISTWRPDLYYKLRNQLKLEFIMKRGTTAVFRKVEDITRESI